MQLRMYRVLLFFKVLEYNLSVGLLISTLVRNATVSPGTLQNRPGRKACVCAPDRGLPLLPLVYLHILRTLKKSITVKPTPLMHAGPCLVQHMQLSMASGPHPTCWLDPSLKT